MGRIHLGNLFLDRGRGGSVSARRERRDLQLGSKSMYMLGRLEVEGDDLRDGLLDHRRPVLVGLEGVERSER